MAKIEGWKAKASELWNSFTSLFKGGGDKAVGNAVGGAVTVSASSVTINAPSITLNGDVSVTGTVVAVGDVVGAGVSLSTHTHGGVESGGKRTSGPA
ncbi:hypothetical protein [uncultured Moraxella sp.]|uniref:hypothetical protein n=1 Tax=uncultured Moraxella sp. TaxID=263769 RepID=UPI0025CF8529|nr:hypothetical protein [uncultured Moraxella sp.]